MFITYVIVAAVLAVAMLMSAYTKLTRNPRVVEGLTRLGVPLSWFPLLATAEIAGALGLLAGIFYPPLGIAAAIGLILYFVGAVITHLRARDIKGLGSPGTILVIAALSLIFGIAAA